MNPTELLEIAENYPLIEIVIAIVVSALVALITSYWTSRQQLMKFPFEIQKIYAETLQNKRIELYPKYYSMICDFIKKANKRQITHDFLTNWFEQFMLVDAEVSLYLSGRSSNYVYNFYTRLEELISLHFVENKINLEDFYERLYALRADKLENHLRTDLGIYIVEFDPEKGKKIYTYDDI